MKANVGAIELTFLGTRAELKSRSRRHRCHSSLLVHYGDARMMIDCGADWLGRLHAIAPIAIVLTHAHPDHASGLAEGAPCPVYATKETLDLLHRYPIHDRHTLVPRQSITIGGVKFEAFPVQHSIRAPAVGYRGSAGKMALQALLIDPVVNSASAAVKLLDELWDVNRPYIRPCV